MARVLKLNHTKKITNVLGASEKYETFAVEAAFLVFCSTSAEPDIRDLANFTPVARYANRNPISVHEIGSCEEFRFVTSPELTEYADGGVVTASAPTLLSNSTRVDVYPFMIMGQDACYDVALQGLNSFKMNHIPHTQVDSSDPGGQRGYVYTGFWCAPLLVNAGWMGVVEAGVTKQT